MLKKLVNECKFNLKITTQGPLLVKSGHATSYGPDMTPVLTYRNNREQVFIPGSSLKGVFRSHIEKVIRTLNEPAVCALEKPETENGRPTRQRYNHVFCGEKFELRKQTDQLTNPVVYKDSCPACRLFGSTFFTGRVSPGDAYLVEGSGVENFTENRDGIGIDRFSGGTAHRAKFDLKVVSAGVSFETEIYMRNFEIWQLGAFMLILQDLEDQLIRIGSGRSRGLGSIKGTTEQVDIQYIKPNITDKNTNEIWGLGKFLNGSGDDYGTDPDDILTLTHPPDETERGIRSVQKFNDDSLSELKEIAVNCFVQKVQNWTAPATMQFDHLNFQAQEDG